MENKKYIVWRLIDGRARNQLMDLNDIMQLIGDDYDVVPTEHNEDYIAVGNGEFIGFGVNADGDLTHHSLWLDQEVFIQYVKAIKEEIGH